MVPCRHSGRFSYRKRPCARVIFLLGLNPFSHPRKKSKSGIGAELRRETGRFPCFPAFPQISTNHFQSIDNLFHSLSDLTATRPPAPVLRRNMLRRRTGAGGRETIEKHGVVSLTKSKFLSFIFLSFLPPCLRRRRRRHAKRQRQACRNRFPQSRFSVFLRFAKESMARGDPMPPCSPPMAPLPLSTAIRIDRTVPARSDQENSGKNPGGFREKSPQAPGLRACPRAFSNDKRNKSHSRQTTIRPLSPARSSRRITHDNPAIRSFQTPHCPKTYLFEKSADGVAKVVCTSKNGKTEQSFDALDWLARIVVHIPNKYEQLVRYVGYYSNKSRGMRKKGGSRRCDTGRSRPEK